MDGHIASDGFSGGAYVELQNFGGASWSRSRGTTLRILFGGLKSEIRFQMRVHNMDDVSTLEVH